MGLNSDVSLPRHQVEAPVYQAAGIDDAIDWGLLHRGIPDVWRQTQGEGVLVGVVDTGQPQHTDLGPLGFSHNFTADGAVDNHGHATHVCGIIAARQNNQGIVGVAPLAKIGTAKGLDDRGRGTAGGIANAVRACVAEGCRIINLSLGSIQRSPEIAEACLDAAQRGVFVICAAGNSGPLFGLNTVSYPAREEFTIAVGSYNRDGKISAYSSRGPQLDVCCPGEKIMSCWPVNKYREVSGTSMAAPFLTGLVALMIAAHDAAERAGQPVKTPIRTYEQLREHIRRHAVDQGAHGHDNAWGYGIPRADGFVRAAPAPEGKRLQVIDDAVIEGHTGLFIYWG